MATFVFKVGVGRWIQETWILVLPLALTCTSHFPTYLGLLTY